MYEQASERWSPVQSVEKVILSVISMLAGLYHILRPFPDHPPTDDINVQSHRCDRLVPVLQASVIVAIMIVPANIDVPC